MYQAHMTMARGLTTREIPLGAPSENLRQTIDVARGFMYDHEVVGTYVVDLERHGCRGPLVKWHSRYEDKNSAHYERDYTKRVLKEAA